LAHPLGLPKMATVAEEILGHVLEFLRAVDIARGRCASRGSNQRAAGIVAAATCVEALLLNTTDLDTMIDHACDKLRVQCQPGCVLLLHTRFRRHAAVTQDLMRALEEKGVVPKGARVVRVQTFGLLGRTAGGHMMEVEEGAGVLLVVLPEALAQVALGDSAVVQQIDSARRGSADVLATTLIFSDQSHVLENEDGEDGILPPNVFGGRSAGKIQEMKDGFGRESPSMSIAWKRCAGTTPSGRSFSAAHLQTMANGRFDPSKAGRRQSSERLVQDQRRAFASVSGGATPGVVAVFACNGRGLNWYHDQHVEAEILDDVYGRRGQDATPPGTQPPAAIFGMFCGGELGPAVDGSSSDSDSDGGQQTSACQRESASSWKVISASATASTQDGAGSSRSPGAAVAEQPQVTVSKLQGFTTIVGVIG